MFVCLTKCPRGVDHKGCGVVLKAGCVIKGKICMSERKIVKTVIAMEKTSLQVKDF